MADVSQTNLRQPTLDAGADDDGNVTIPVTVDKEGKDIIFTLNVGEDIEFTNVKSGDNEGHLMAILKSLTVIGPCGCDAPVGWQYVSAGPFRAPRKGSPMGVFLTRAGITVPPGSNREVFETACKSTKNRQIRATLDWACRDKDADVNYVGYANFPLAKANDGTRWPGLAPGTTFGDGTIVGSTPLRAALKVKWFQRAEA